MLKYIAFFAKVCYNINMNTFIPHSKHLHFDYLLDTSPTAEDRKGEYYCHMHNDYEVLFFYKGNADYIIENQSYHLKTNDMLLIKPMVYHGLNVLSSEPYERCVFNFARIILSEQQLAIIDKSNPIYHIDEHSPIRHIFDTLRACEKILTEQEFEYMKTSSLYNILATLHHLPAGKRPSKSESTKLDEILEYIHSHPELPLNTQTLGERFFVSKSWIDHTFKTHLKMSTKQYINQKKVLYAQSLILSGLPITEVAERCNYKNYTTFYRQYVCFLGHEPYQDRKDLIVPKSHKKK